jgi:hypothetical protein
MRRPPRAWGQGTLVSCQASVLVSPPTPLSWEASLVSPGPTTTPLS